MCGAAVVGASVRSLAAYAAEPIVAARPIAIAPIRPLRAMFRVVRMMILQQTLPSSSAAGAAVPHACQPSQVLKYNKPGDRLARKTPKNGRGGKNLARHTTKSPHHHQEHLHIKNPSR